nr:TRAP transporter small permease [Propionibacterium sp.]
MNKAVGWLLVALFSVMTVTYFSQIVLRYVFQTGLHWTEELTRYCQVALIMFGAAVLAGKNSHINVSVLEALVKPRIRKWVVIGQQLLTAAFFLIATKIAFDVILLTGTQLSTNMRIPMRFVYGMFPVAYTILVFNVVVFILNKIREVPVEDVREETVAG